MYPSPHRPTGPPNLARYGSAPGSFLTSVVESVVNGTDEQFTAIGSETLMTRFFTGGDSNSIPTTESNSSKARYSSESEIYRNNESPKTGLQRSYGLNQLAAGDLASPNLRASTGGGGGGGGGSLLRQSSSPAGFFNHLVVENGFTVTRPHGGYSSQGGSSGGHGHANARLATQLSFTRQDSLSQISEVSENMGDGSSSDEGARQTRHTYGSGGFPMGSWDDSNGDHTIMFSSPHKRAKNNGDMSGVDSQFSLPRTSLEMSAVEKMLHLQPDSVPCKIRAKRGFATHPRSIAERERRTRISEKLRKLQELVPNMDKQTSTADMLDLAVQHIKGLQNEVQKLNKDMDKCTCGCKPAQ
ncbi:hypothetical protein ACHQM5_028281 [Ranunculus cassubicifolius]